MKQRGYHTNHLFASEAKQKATRGKEHLGGQDPTMSETSPYLNLQPY